MRAQRPLRSGLGLPGLPIEHQVHGAWAEKEAIGRAPGRDPPRNCWREYAAKFIDIQREEFKRLGVFGDWDNPYLTMNYAYEAAIVRELGKFVGAGGVYKGKKPVYWCGPARPRLPRRRWSTRTTSLRPSR